MDYRRVPVLVGVFGDRSRAERAAHELWAQGCGEDDLGVVWPEAGRPCGSGGLGSAVEHEVGPLLSALGIADEPAAYYQREVAAGRCLLLVGGAAAGQARTAIGRNCGTVRLPEDAKAA